MFARDLVRILNGRGLENNPDFIEVGPKIEDVRNLKSFLSNKPYFGPYQVAIIDDADRMTIEASNALLKALEEPSKSSVLILVSSKPRSLLSTIYSRCQEIKFQPLKEEELVSIIPAELKSEDKDLLKQLSRGRPGWILKNLENIDDIRSSIHNFNKVLNQGIFEKIQYASKMHDKDDLPELVNNLIHWHYSQDGKQAKLLKNLVSLSNIVSQSQYNHRLALENFLLFL